MSRSLYDIFVLHIVWVGRQEGRIYIYRKKEKGWDGEREKEGARGKGEGRNEKGDCDIHIVIRQTTQLWYHW